LGGYFNREKASMKLTLNLENDTFASVGHQVAYSKLKLSANGGNSQGVHETQSQDDGLTGGNN
jgi:hypothetical protein